MIVLVHPVTFSPLITHFTGTPCFTVKTLGSNPLAVTFIVTVCDAWLAGCAWGCGVLFFAPLSCWLSELITFVFTPLKTSPELNVYTANKMISAPATF